MYRAKFFLGLGIVALLLVAAPASQAAKVRSLKPWKPDNRYLVTTDLDGRKAPKSEPRAKVDFLREGQWVRIKCQAAGQTAYGSNLWDKVGRYYVPDTYLKTYTSGRIPGAPRCKRRSGSTPPPPSSSGPTFPSAGLPAPGDGYASYEQTYGLGKRFKGWTYGEMTHTLRRRFSRYFPFKGCGRRISVGKRCRLQAPGPDGPVRVTHIASNGFALKSLKGHPEGAGRTITFRWARWCNAMSDYLYCDHTYLRVNAWGPVGGASILGPINELTIAKYYWTKFSKNIRRRYPKCPPGKAWSTSHRTCGVIV